MGMPVCMQENITKPWSSNPKNWKQKKKKALDLQQYLASRIWHFGLNMLFQLRVQTPLFVPEGDDSLGCSWRETKTLLNSHMGFQVCLEKKPFSCGLNHLMSPLSCHCPFLKSSHLLFFSWLKGEHWGEFEITAQSSCCHLAAQSLPDSPAPKAQVDVASQRVIAAQHLPHTELTDSHTSLRGH